jgi:phosphatidylserine/phosphatidylglycerophosphate/cardiolipin synthase-like enzyme
MLNTEMGVIVESPRIAAALSEALDRWDMVFELTRGHGGSLIWREQTPNGEEVVHDRTLRQPVPPRTRKGGKLAAGGVDSVIRTGILTT